MASVNDQALLRAAERLREAREDQMVTAIASLKERGCAATQARRSYATGPGAFEDAMTEYHTLRERPEG